MIIILSTTLSGVFIMGAESDTGILYHLGDNWYIDPYYLENNNDLGWYLGISNPESFPFVLIPENDGREVHYIHNTPDPVWGLWVPHFVWLYSLDLVPVFIIKQFILYFSIAISSLAVFTYLLFNRKRFPITNRLLK
jgi:hypothetical protein